MSQLLAATLADGRLQVWLLDTFDKLTSRRQTSVGTDARWTAWSSFPNPGLKYIAAAPLPLDGRLLLFGGNEFQSLWTAQQISTDPNAGWSDWQPFPSPEFATGVVGVAVAPLEDGRLQVMIVAGFTDAWVSRMVGIDINEGWSDWTKL
jgi:hypothetical protein